jgi:hypothetical protein
MRYEKAPHLNIGEGLSRSRMISTESISKVRPLILDIGLLFVEECAIFDTTGINSIPSF